MPIPKLPSTCPDQWPSNTYKLLVSARAYLDDPEPPSRASILASRLIEVANQSTNPTIRDITVRLLGTPVLGKGSQVERWSLGSYFSLKDRTHIPIHLDILSRARDNIVMEKADALIRAFEREIEPLTASHVVLAIRLERHTGQDIALKMVQALLPDQEGARRIQAAIFKNWLMESSNGVKGCALLRQLYANIDMITRMDLLRQMPDTIRPNALPFLATLAQENIAAQHHIVLELTQKIGHKDGEPVVLILLDSRHERTVSKAAVVASEIGTRRCLSKIQQAKDRVEDNAIFRQLCAAEDAIDARHPETYVEDGALSLSPTVGTSGALSLTEEQEGSLSLYDRVSRGTQTQLTTPKESTLAMQVLKPWQHMEPAPRTLPAGFRARMFLFQHPIWATLSFTSAFGGVWAMSYQILQSIKTAVPIGANSNFTFFVYASFGGFIGLATLFVVAHNTLYTIRDGDLAQAQYTGSKKVQTSTDAGMRLSHDYTCKTVRGETVDKSTLQYVPKTNKWDPLPVLVGKDDNKIVFLERAPISIGPHGAIKSSPLWTAWVVALLLLYISSWTYLLNLLPMMPK